MQPHRHHQTHPRQAHNHRALEPALTILQCEFNGEDAVFLERAHELGVVGEGLAEGGARVAEEGAVGGEGEEEGGEGDGGNGVVAVEADVRWEGLRHDTINVSFGCNNVRVREGNEP